MRFATTPTGAAVLDRTKSESLAKEAVEQEKYFLDALENEIFPAAGRYWKLYLAKRPDPRREHEKWRANVFLPYPFVTAETQVAQIVEINTASQPFIQAGGTGDEDFEGARNIERLLDYSLIANHWRRLLTTNVRALTVQGTDFLKTVWTKRAFKFNIEFEGTELIDYRKRIEEIVQRFQIAPPPDFEQDPAKFEEWRQIVNKDGRARVPAIPKPGPQEIVQYEGPLIERVPFWDIRMDPNIQEIRDQHCIIQRLVKPKSWLTARTGDDPTKPFDPAMVDVGLAGWDGQAISKYEQELAEAIGISIGREQNPYYKEAVEILEKWTPGTEYPFQVILNGKTVINKHPDRMPYLSGMPSLTAVRKVVIPGFGYGMSTLMQPEALFYEGNSLRNLRLDAVTLSTLPIFTRLREAGLPELQRKLTPASIIEVSRGDAIKQLMTQSIAPDAFREMPEIKLDIDDAEGTGSNVRGASASVNRVSASENQGRLNQALLRGKLGAVTVEEDLSTLVPQLIGLWAQFGNDSVRVRIGGKPDAILEIGKHEILDSLHADFRFRGATRAINKDQTVQNLQTFTKDFKDMMHPGEIRASMRVIAETMNIPLVSRIVSDEVTGQMVMAFEKQKTDAAAAAQQQTTANNAAKGTAEAPATIPVDQAAAAQEGAKDSGQPPQQA